MIRSMGLLAGILSLSLTVALSLRLKHERYAGLVLSTTSTDLTIDVLERLEDEGDMEYPPPPATLKGSLRGFKYGKDFLVFTVEAPPFILNRATKNEHAEVKHAYLDLPFFGPAMGATTFVLCSYEWRQPRWPLYGFLVTVALAPLFLWMVVVGLNSFAEAKSLQTLS